MKPTYSDEQSVFKAYVNSYKINNITLPGTSGLSYLKYQYERLGKIPVPHPNMKLLVEITFILSKSSDGETEILDSTIRSRRYEISNTDELKTVLDNIRKDIELIFRDVTDEKVRSNCG